MFIPDSVTVDPIHKSVCKTMLVELKWLLYTVPPDCLLLDHMQDIRATGRHVSSERSTSFSLFLAFLSSFRVKRKTVLGLFSVSLAHLESRFFLLIPSLTYESLSIFFGAVAFPEPC